ncbi:hypothetical protein P4H61_04105 [Paenibacillus peoriae]|uniref:hypothetical protein n=1 Tax=Paenibacillus peoriae TaxID=59893 RepID=UPI00026C5D69|nr:hypothetical protein [Paenibacillus peoriae]MEC0180680.1 hypothetical protein [Paenibacillus peoriae]
MYDVDLESIPRYNYAGTREIKMLKEIIILSRNILFGQIHYNKVKINNEADLQLHFSYILKSVGDLFEFGLRDHLRIHLEAPFRSEKTLPKSESNRSKIDIVLEWISGSTNTVTTCAIELKYFLWEGLREPQNRYSVFCDLANLEEYIRYCPSYSDDSYLNPWTFQMGYFLVGTDNPHYVNQKSYSKETQDFDFRHNTTYKAGTTLTYHTRNKQPKTLSLANNYHFLWQRVGDFYYMDHFF